jgi:hypothetical protein
VSPLPRVIFGSLLTTIASSTFTLVVSGRLQKFPWQTKTPGNSLPRPHQNS